MRKGSRTPLTTKRICILRELASMGVSITKAAELTDASVQTISLLAKKGCLKMPKGRTGRGPYMESLVMRDFGKEGVTAPVMAERYGSTRKSINVIVCRLRKAGKLPPSSHPRVKPAKLAPELEANP